jgi:hypothetical protein
MMKYLAITFVVAVASLAALTPADARGGCGIGRHHGLLGVCVDNATTPVVVAPRAAVVAPGDAVVTTGGTVVVAPVRRLCPLGWHLGPLGHCRRN